VFLFRTTGECECGIQLLIHFHDRSPHPSLQPLRTLLSSPTEEVPEPPGNARAETTEHPPEPPSGRSTVVDEQLIVQGDNRLIGSRIPLTSTTSEQLAIDTTGIMAFRRDDMESAPRNHIRIETDISSSPCHIRRHGNTPRLGGPTDDGGLIPILPGIEDLMLESCARQQSAEML